MVEAYERGGASRPFFHPTDKQGEPVYEKLFSLPVASQLSHSLSLRQMGEQPILVIDHPKVRAAIAFQGAHLLAWQPEGHQPVIWLSEKSNWQPGKAIRGGVPICWPWFGASAEPSHGFVRNLPWSLSAHDENDEGVLLTLTLTSSQQTEQYWPHPFTLLARFRLSSHCEIELEAQGNYQSTGALHSYFSVADCTKAQVTGLGVSWIDKITHLTETGTEEPCQSFTQPVDRIFTQPENVSVIDDQMGGRFIEIYHHHHSDVVTWNPGAELSARMTDMPADGYKKMVCVESARITRSMQSTNDQPAKLAATLRVRAKK